MNNDRKICNEAKYPHGTTLTKRFVVKITVERCDKIIVAVSQIFEIRSPMVRKYP
jgi:hypothetical protein